MRQNDLIFPQPVERYNVQSMTKILFLCSANSCRSQMAEGFARARNEPDVEVSSAGTQASRVHPVAIEVMAEAGIDVSKHKSKSIDDLDSLAFDVVITLCENAARDCPILPGNPEKVDWNVKDPTDVSGGQAELLEWFRNTRDEIRRLVDDLFDRGYFLALARARKFNQLIVDNISDGIIAHDMHRRIFYFNKAAQDITGYTREEVLNRDCHEVFPGSFCGSKCQFCDGAVVPKELTGSELDIVTKKGEKKTIEMTIRKMTDDTGNDAGVLVSFRDLTRERRLARRAGEINSFSGIIGRDHKMLEIFDIIGDLSDSNVPVLIEGESGTGKELVAAAIHNEGPRANKLFVPVNCGALPESLLESELFGHVKGAFTGAIRDKKGRFELADGGTILLDEIGDIPPSMQVRLLRVLQEGKFERVGGEKTIKVDVRVISATNKDLQEEIAAGRFRDDLYYRLSVVPLTMPPLRLRRNDVPLLVDHVLSGSLKAAGKSGITVSQEALNIMMSYDWPGNVRELQNWIQFALVKCKRGEITPEHLPPRSRARNNNLAEVRKRGRSKLSVASVRQALAETQGNKLDAARLLGVSRATLYRFLDDTKEI